MLAILAVGAISVILGVLSLVFLILRAIYHSTDLVVSANSAVAKQNFNRFSFSETNPENLKNYILFRYFPGLFNKLPVAELFDFKTTSPIHTASFIAQDGSKHSFYVKREDLLSDLYGGNKIRTLIHQLPAISQKLDIDLPVQNNITKTEKQVYVLGSGGSNQSVACLVHGFYRMGLPVRLLQVKDPPELDNTLNFLSCLSIKGVSAQMIHSSESFRALKTILSWLVGGKKPNVLLLPPGGHAVSGVLGHLSAVLELAEQIERGEIPDVDHIYLPIGSSCTITGLTMGVALSRHLKLKAFQKPGFKIKGVPVHHGLAKLSRKLDFYRGKWPYVVAISPRYSINKTSEFFQSLTGINLLAGAEFVLENQAEIIDDEQLVGEYGKHSKVSQTTTGHFERTGKVVDANGNECENLFLCGHFTGKSFTMLYNDIVNSDKADVVRLMWQTKSIVQPRGPVDEFKEMCGMGDAVKKWANEGCSRSLARPGNFSTEKDDEKSRFYRAYMKSLP